MIAASTNSAWQNIIPIIFLVFLLGAVGFLIVLIVKGHRKLVSRTDRAHLGLFEDLPTSTQTGPGLVFVVFHTYYGFLVFVHQLEHRFWASPDDARQILARLNRFNLTRGFFAYGALVIPILSLMNYWVQLRRIRKQAAAFSAQ
jgi:hypothetical protein